MEYMLIHTVDPELAPATSAEEDEAWKIFTAWSDELDAADDARTLHGSRLCPPADATTIMIKDGKLLITDGPYAETREQIGGYDVMECAGIDAAIGWAGKHPHALMGSVEARPLHRGQSEANPPAELADPGVGSVRYLMLIWIDRAAETATVHKIIRQNRLARGGETPRGRVFAAELEPADTARTVRIRSADVAVSDGPFCQEAQQLAGFELLDAADLDEVIKVASTHPLAPHAVLEVRPLWTS